MITQLADLLFRLKLTSEELDILKDGLDYPLLAPESWVDRIAPGDPHDPLLHQILPRQAELANIAEFNQDPLAEAECTPVTGLIHRYHGRVLLLVTAICALNCRFCFRRHSREVVTDWSAVFNYIAQDATISEVILSGGDPLMLEDSQLNQIIQNLSNIPQVKRIRIHTRVPIVMPERVRQDLFPADFPVVVVVHCNHPQELNAEVSQAIQRLKAQGDRMVFNQSVLLRGVNDRVETLVALSEELFRVGIIPYYLHLLDKVRGASHFYLEPDEARQLYGAMRQQLPGYLVPKLIVEQAGKKHYLN